MRVTMILIVIYSLGTIPNRFGKVDGRVGRTETIQTIALLRLARILEESLRLW